MFGTETGRRPKFLSVGKQQSTQLTQLSQYCMGTSCLQGNVKMFSPHNPVARRKVSIARRWASKQARSRKSSGNTAFPKFLCSLTTSVQLCHPKHRAQRLPLPGGSFLLSCVRT